MMNEQPTPFKSRNKPHYNGRAHSQPAPERSDGGENRGENRANTQHWKKPPSEATLKLIDGIYRKDVVIASKALKDGAMVNVRIPNGMTPLLMACRDREVSNQMVALLVKAKANLMDKTVDGISAEELLEANGRHDILQMIFAYSMADTLN